MRIVRSQSELDALVDEYSQAPYVAVDTEFMRERTYWPALCLIQIARPALDGGPVSKDARSAAIIDPIETDLDLGPLFDLMHDPKVVKVFHAARQDAEIFHHLSGSPPRPLYDTQIAAMVCGFGDQVAYETVVRKVVGGALDKSSRFTDWARRPLSQKQLSYALGDVTHLRGVYESFVEQISREGRLTWVQEEMAALEDPSAYENEPDEAWRRLKTRATGGRFLAVARELAAWREREAQRRDVPRSRLLKDEALLEICANQPTTMEELSRSRLLFREGRKTEVAEEILAAVKRGLDTPKDKLPEPPAPKTTRTASPALMDLLRVLLKAKTDAVGVAQRLVASAADLELIAVDDDADTPSLRGWRREVFGDDALRLKRGEIALTAGADGVRIVPL